MRLILALALSLVAVQAHAFCGFYVARGDAKLFNEASKVVYMRDGNRSVITMVSDYEGEPKDFAMVVPTPSVLEEGQIHVTDPAIVEHLDAFTAPRLVEYFDEDPCRPVYRRELAMTAQVQQMEDAGAGEEKSLGVTVEAEYSVGEYDIIILSAEQSDGLETWLKQNGYRIPDGASQALAGYIDADMKFFVAKVNLQEHAAKGGGFLRPIQIAFESPDFMLPIKLGMVNAKGTQDLLLYTLTRTGRVETANYSTAKMPTDANIPTFVKEEFGSVYKAIYAETVRKEGGAAVLLEYAWDMSWCDPCAADPLSARELRELGAYWVPQDLRPESDRRQPIPTDVFVTRLHARYDEASFPEDLMLRETGNRENFQGRYIMTHPWDGKATCPAGEAYVRDLPVRYEREAQTLANLTGWPISDIRDKQDRPAPPKDQPKWWETIWDGDR